MIPALVGLAFGFLWLLVGASGLAPPASIFALTAGTAIYALALWRTIRLRTRRARFDRRFYIGAVVAELVAIAIAQRWLPTHQRPQLVFPVIAIIVGLHFIGLWLAAKDRRYLILSGALVAVGAAATFLPLTGRGRLIVAGFGSSAALLGAVSA